MATCGELCLCWPLLLKDNSRTIRSMVSCGWLSFFVDSDALCLLCVAATVFFLLWL
ncbi:predicted protein [Arabidopsis lyrata subsp. lyrata]|uniref:Predicted protein n=1 Tax=Arabidopsis lyrata subsp. lyrata TaxID=81972 RepID=D7L2I8_ARALL|nr:predicted protein [Arabidopsis lyrata subsp. lyrata]